jgi:hypothetical protein
VAQYAEGEGRYNRKGKVRFLYGAKNWLVCYVIYPVATRCVFRDGGNQNRWDDASKMSNYHCSHS